MNILLIQLAKMGDIIQSKWLIDDLIKEYPQAEIYLLHSEIFSEVVHEFPQIYGISVNLDKISEVYDKSVCLNNSSFSDELIEQLNILDADLVINLNSTQIAIDIVMQLDSPKKLGFGSDDDENNRWINFAWSFIKSRRMGTLNLVDIFRNIIRSEKRIMPSKHENVNNNVIFQMGSRNAKRQLPVEKFVQFAHIYLKKGKEVILVGVDSEKEIGENFLTHFTEDRNIKNEIGKTNISQLFSYIKSCDKLITTDTGTLHIGALFSVPTDAYFIGPAYFMETAGYNMHQVIISPDLTKFKCYPCKDEEKCPFNLQCHYLDGNNSLYWRPNFDEIGIWFSPVTNIFIWEEMFFALHYRSFLASYMTQCNINTSKYLHNYRIDSEVVNIWLRKLKRELQIFYVFKEDYEKIRNGIDNFEILKPLIYYLILMKKSDDKLLNFMLENFEILTKKV